MANGKNTEQGSVVLIVAGVLLLSSGGLIGAYFVGAGGDGSSEPAMTEVEKKASPAVAPQKVDEFLQFAVEVGVGKHMTELSWGQLGVVPAAGDREGEIPVELDPSKAAIALKELKVRFDRFPSDARMALEERRIVPHQSGLVIDLYGSMAVIEAAARSGENRVDLPMVTLPAQVTEEDLGIRDISNVLASFTTRFAIMEKTRNHNLKLAASRLDGHILKPGELFSFNEIVGARSEQEGYKIAHVITAGQMVDGLAGGTCQISTTLHGAAFFSGLEIVRSTPHSRPSTYVHMGLDATVVWPHTDLKLRNNYEFPVVIHYRVTRGESVVEILGKKRPYDEIAFEREIEEEIEFDTVTREDEELPVGTMNVDQYGFPGYKMKRFRKYYRKGRLVKTDEWNLNYRPVTEYVRTGINPDPNLPPPKLNERHGPKPPKELTFRLAN